MGGGAGGGGGAITEYGGGPAALAEAGRYMVVNSEAREDFGSD